MGPTKADLLRDYSQQIESQVQFGDNKATLLITGNGILLAISGGLARTVSGCPEKELAAECVALTPQLGLAIGAGLLIVFSLTCALFAARPAAIHKNPLPELFLFSYVGGLDKERYLELVGAATDEKLATDALCAIWGKAHYARKKFRWLRYAIHASLASLFLLVGSVLAALLPVIALP